MIHATADPVVARLLAIALPAVCLAACGESGAEAPSLPVLYDGTLVATVAVGDLEEGPVRLVEVLDGAAGDPAGWIRVEAHSLERTVFQVVRPAELYADQDVSLFLAEDGRPSIGLFRFLSPSVDRETRRWRSIGPFPEETEEATSPDQGNAAKSARPWAPRPTTDFASAPG